MYVANGINATASVLVFAHGANGNVSPIRKLSGLRTGIEFVESMTVDQKTGTIFVIDGGFQTGQSTEASVLRFPPNASGNEAPFARSPRSLSMSQITSDSTGENLIATFVSTSPYDNGISDFAKQFANNTNPGGANLDNIGQFFGSGIADDPNTKTYLASGIPVDGGYANGSNGSIAPAVSAITSDTCGSQLALGYLRNIYVVHSKQNYCANDAIYVCEHDASGRAVPLTDFNRPRDEAERAIRNLRRAVTPRWSTGRPERSAFLCATRLTAILIRYDQL